MKKITKPANLVEFNDKIVVFTLQEFLLWL